MRGSYYAMSTNNLAQLIILSNLVDGKSLNEENIEEADKYARMAVDVCKRKDYASLDTLAAVKYYWAIHVENNHRERLLLLKEAYNYEESAFKYCDSESDEGSLKAIEKRLIMNILTALNEELVRAGRPSHIMDFIIRARQLNLRSPESKEAILQMVPSI